MPLQNAKIGKIAKISDGFRKITSHFLLNARKKEKNN